MNNKRIIDELYYHFNASDGEISFENKADVRKEDILLITNITRNKILYNFGCTTEGGTYENGILSFIVDTSEMEDTDKLLVIAIDKDNDITVLSKIESTLKDLVELTLSYNESNNSSLLLQDVVYELRNISSDTYRYEHISTAASTQCKLGSGKLYKVIVNNPTNNSITIYDGGNTNGKIIGIIDPDAGTTPFELNYNLQFDIGLLIVTAGTPDLTIIFN